MKKKKYNIWIWKKGKSAHCENENGAISCIIFHAIKRNNIYLILKWVCEKFQILKHP